MKRAIDIVQVNVEDWAPFSLDVCLPGKLRDVIPTMTPPSSILSAPNMGMPPPTPIPVPALVFEIDPDAEKVKRSYLWLALGVKLTYDGALEFRAKYTDPATGQPLFLFEVCRD